MTDNRLSEYPLLTQMDKERIRAEIFASCELVGDCWIYLGPLNAGGYGVKRMNSKLHSVSRFMLAYHTRESLNCRFDACHDTDLCPYKACCNPEHLFWASHSENCRQREQRKREQKALLEGWSKRAWIDGVFYTDRADPSIGHCITSLRNGAIDRKNGLEKHSLTGSQEVKVRACSVSPFVPILAPASLVSLPQGNIATL